MRRPPLPAWSRNLSLANKCLLLFGGAATLIVSIALGLVWLRMNMLVGEGQLETSRAEVRTWERQGADETFAWGENSALFVLSAEHARAAGEDDPFLARALARFEAGRPEHHAGHWDGLTRVYRYARARRGEDGSLESVVVLARRSDQAPMLFAVNTLYILAAGLVVLAVALVVFYIITSRLILDPVRSLQATAERVRDGHLHTRSQIHTGDEFEELAGTFNLMLSEIEAGQDQLRAINTALDVKLTELAEANVALHETARLKGEFLAGVSHELRTPLNSIIGFAELLLDLARAEAREHASESATDGDPASARALEKRERYLTNIVTAGRSLLEMIESLLEMAKLEAGRVDVQAAPMNVRETCHGLVGLIHPLAQRKGITVRVEVWDDVPMIETDAKKFQQIVFNLLSNAVKFVEGHDAGTSRRGEIVVRAERLPATAGRDGEDRIRVSVIDNGPGIAPEDHARIFEKFQQLDTGHTRMHAGTGLGLAICKELATVLQGEIQLVSDVGRGSMFSLILPRSLDPERTEELRLESRFRGALAGRQRWT